METKSVTFTVLAHENDTGCVGTFAHPLDGIESIESSLFKVYAESREAYTLLDNALVYACSSLSDVSPSNYVGEVGVGVGGDWILVPDEGGIDRLKGKETITIVFDTVVSEETIAVQFDMTYEVNESKYIAYYNGSGFDACSVHYYDGTQFVSCKPYYYDGTQWLLCAQY